jgi:tyrosyl-tRNA synthetase
VTISGAVRDEAGRQLESLCAGAAEVISREDLLHKLEGALAAGRPLRAKLGADPSAPDLHLGHTVVLNKLRQFQDLGHTAIFLIGDFTGMIGDPTGKSETRKPLTRDEVLANAETYKAQIFKVLDPARTEIRFNSEWLAALGFADVVRLCAQYTVARILERDDFAGRYREGRAIGLHEFLYPMAQAYDSVALKADVELGGTDQKFNLLVGRDVQRAYGQDPQVALILPILEGTDGVQKMSKSVGNAVGIAEAPDEMFGKIMSIPDEVMGSYYNLVSGLSSEDLEAVHRGLREMTLHPKEAKVRLGRLLVARYHSPAAAEAAAGRFEKVFSRRELPEEMPRIAKAALAGPDGSLDLVRLIVEADPTLSKSEARRLIIQGGVEVDGTVVRELHHRLPVEGEQVLRVGKRRFVRLVPEEGAGNPQPRGKAPQKGT